MNFKESIALCRQEPQGNGMVVPSQSSLAKVFSTMAFPVGGVWVGVKKDSPFITATKPTCDAVTQNEEVEPHIRLVGSSKKKPSHLLNATWFLENCENMCIKMRKMGHYSLLLRDEDCRAKRQVLCQIDGESFMG